MPPPRVALEISRTLAEDPQLAFDLYCLASEIIDDFDDYGPVLQANEAGEYDDASTIMKLRACRDLIRAKLAASQP
jgi:hypothetical protein